MAPYAPAGGFFREVCADNRTRTYFYVRVLSGADYGARTRHLDLGKVALYQMS